ncbi:hypothetical protein [Bacillus clarus]|uniref:Putative membrane protein n=1 Tax=Bacillus clarus TaxID=2338372 RepID=A0A090YPS9_9BACI|nr:hypothetical protein [Bacillus clarus]KFM99952.1 putative membrane protein [Bacillus clarus]
MTLLAWISLVINVIIVLVMLDTDDSEKSTMIFWLVIQFPTLLFIVLYLIG